MHIANVCAREPHRCRYTLYDAERETNCRVVGRNGSWPWLSLINSAHWAPLITAACHRHGPPSPESRRSRSRSQASRRLTPHNTYLRTHPCRPLLTQERTHALKPALFMHGFTDCEKNREFQLLLLLVTGKKRIFKNLALVFYVTCMKP